MQCINLRERIPDAILHENFNPEFENRPGMIHGYLLISSYFVDFNLVARKKKKKKKKRIEKETGKRGN